MRKICFVIAVFLVVIAVLLFYELKIIYKEQIDQKVWSDYEIPFIEGVKNLTFNGQSKLDLFSHLHISDNSNKKLVINIEGTYDLTINDIYHLYYVVVDGAGNTVKIPFSLTVNILKSTPELKTNYELTTLKGFHLKVEDGVTFIDNHVIVNKTFSIPKDYVPSDLVELNNRSSISNHVNQAFKLLVNDAAVVGLNIYASTGYRSYTFQNVLYTNYVQKDGQEIADKYSARPGYSEHQTGLAIDLNTVNNLFKDTQESKWLNQNCHKYGFIIRYPEGKENITGYEYEPWHIRYVGEELAFKLYNNGNWITMEEYFGISSIYE